jgi:hypothetical protein
MRIAPLFALIAAVLASVLGAAPAQTKNAQTWVSGTNGLDSNTADNCFRTSPCQTFAAALTVTSPGGIISCADPASLTVGPVVIDIDVTIDCGESYGSILGFNTAAIQIVFGVKVTLRGLTIYSLSGFNGSTGIDITDAAIVHLENCKIFGFSGPGVEVAPSSGNVVVKIQDSTITQNGGGVLVAPTSSASVSISIDRSRIENNSGGGVKTDTSSGAISASISDSSISFNNGNGLNAVSISGAQNMLTLVRDVITKNGTAGIQANGANAAALVNNTVLDSNATGATSVVAGGRILTYGNNSIIGTPGSGFTGSAAPQ